MSPDAHGILTGDHESAHGIVDGDELGAVGERGLDLDLADHLGRASITWSRRTTPAPSRINSTTLRPSRAPSGRSQILTRPPPDD